MFWYFFLLQTYIYYSGSTIYVLGGLKLGNKIYIVIVMTLMILVAGTLLYLFAKNDCWYNGKRIESVNNMVLNNKIENLV